VEVRGTGAGLVVAELYDATPAGMVTTSTPRLINLSVLKQVGAASSVTAGFVIRGSTAQTVLIRAVGPRLAFAPFDLPHALAEPTLMLINTGTRVAVATNCGWGGDAQISAAGRRVGAFAITNAASGDAMLLRTLAPGSYTAQVSSAGGGTGLALVEIYEVP
jgi:hypothetical protein